MKRTKQTCTLCGKPSIRGLKPGQGKCPYHWDVGVWGQEWADKVRADLKTQRAAFDERVAKNEAR